MGTMIDLRQRLDDLKLLAIGKRNAVENEPLNRENQLSFLHMKLKEKERELHQLDERNKSLEKMIEKERSKSGIRDVMMKNLENRNKNLEKTIENERSKIADLRRTIDREVGAKRQLNESTQTLRQSNELGMSTTRNTAKSHNTIASIYNPHEARKSELCLLLN